MNQTPFLLWHSMISFYKTPNRNSVLQVFFWWNECVDSSSFEYCFAATNGHSTKIVHFLSHFVPKYQNITPFRWLFGDIPNSTDVSHKFTCLPFFIYLRIRNNCCSCFRSCTHCVDVDHTSIDKHLKNEKESAPEREKKKIRGKKFNS